MLKYQVVGDALRAGAYRQANADVEERREENDISLALRAGIIMVMLMWIREERGEVIA